MRSISLKLTLAFLSISLSGILLIAILARWNTRTEFIRFISEQYQQEFIAQLSTYYQNHQSWQGVEPLFFPPVEPEHPHEQHPVPYILTDPAGYVLLGNASYHVGEHLNPEELENSIPIQAEQKIVGRLLPLSAVFERNPREEEFIQRTEQTLLIGAGGIAILAFLSGIFLSRTIARPIRELTQAAHAIAEGTLGQQVVIHSNDELGELAAAFNKMSTKLERLVNARKQMTADIAHELRTPLSLILGHAEAVHDGVLPPSRENFEIIREEAGRLEKLVEDLRTLSLADAGELSIEPQDIEPARLLQEIMALYRFRAQAQNITFHLLIEPGLPLLHVDPERMIQVLTNILDNALRHTPEGGQITLAAQRTANGVAIQVQDTGPGLPPAELERIFERFYRSNPARNREEGGSGLGLAIAKSIVLAHGGQIQATSQAGTGLKMTITLPTPSTK